MACYTGKLEDGTPYIMCGELGPHCTQCMGFGDNLCDFPVGEGKTCDLALCDEHADQVAPNLHYCPAHSAMWKEFQSSGGVRAVLENVVPFAKSGRVSTEGGEG